jgi:Elongation factor Tu GTP binding domain
MIIGTAGHIDHGKTSLVHALTGVDTDRLKEEKARGISIDLGFAYLPAPDGSILGFVDVPGHEKFVHNMVAGATGIDFVLLVVAADDGPMPQTFEHLAIVDLLGVKRGVVALTKADLAAGAGARGGLSRRSPSPCEDDARGRRDHSALYRHGRGYRRSSRASFRCRPTHGSTFRAGSLSTRGRPLLFPSRHRRSGDRDGPVGLGRGW